MNVIYLDNNHCVELQALTNSATSVVDTGATVTVTIKDAGGSDVEGQVWPATMSHVSGGTYRATLDHDLSLSANRTYYAHVDATGSGGEVGHWELPVHARVRSS